MPRMIHIFRESSFDEAAGLRSRVYAMQHAGYVPVEPTMGVSPHHCQFVASCLYCPRWSPPVVECSPHDSRIHSDFSPSCLPPPRSTKKASSRCDVYYTLASCTRRTVSTPFGPQRPWRGASHLTPGTRSLCPRTPERARGALDPDKWSCRKSWCGSWGLPTLISGRKIFLFWKICEKFSKEETGLVRGCGRAMFYGV